MSEFRRRINRLATSLRQMLPELPHPFAPADVWNSTISAPRTVGGSEQVEAWFLAQHFLATYVDWRDLVDRWQRYFGQADSSVARSSKQLDRRCRSTFLNGVAYSGTLRESLLRTWRSSHSVDDIPVHSSMTWERSPEKTDTHAMDDGPSESLVHELIRTDRYVRIAALLQPEGEAISGGKMVAVARELHSAVANTLRLSTDEVSEEVDFYLRNYRHAMLRVSWLESRDNSRNKDDRSFLNGGPGEHDTISDWREDIKRLIEGMTPRDFDVQLLSNVLNRVHTAVSEIGYEAFAEDISSRDFLGGDESPIGSSGVNLIPGRGKAACHSIVVAVSRGGSRSSKTGFPNVMKQLKTHLIECAGNTRVVICLSDYWDSKAFFAEHFSELQAHYRKGVQFLFWLAVSPGRRMMPVPVNFRTKWANT